MGVTTCHQFELTSIVQNSSLSSHTSHILKCSLEFFLLEWKLKELNREEISRKTDRSQEAKGWGKYIMCLEGQTPRISNQIRVQREHGQLEITVTVSSPSCHCFGKDHAPNKQGNAHSKHSTRHEANHYCSSSKFVPRIIGKIEFRRNFF